MNESLLDEGGTEPLHYQLQRLFTQKIDSGEWPPGHRLDGENTFTDRYGVSRSTVRQAILALVNNGYLTRKQGKGTFVSTEKHDMNVFNLRFTALADAQHQMLRVEYDVTMPEVAAQLGLGQGETLTVVERLRLLKGEPVALEVSHLPSRICPSIPDEESALVDILRHNHNVAIKRYAASVEPVLLDKRQRDHLQYEARPALGLLVMRTGYTGDETPVIVSASTFRGDKCRAVINQ